MLDQMTITLTPEEWDRVLDVLGDGRFKVVNPLIAKILAQARAQNAETERTQPRLQPVS
jgi:hypothetical protein